MLFSSMLFLWLFLPATLILDRLSDRFMGRKSANVILLIASLIFYAWGEPIYILLMLVSIFVNWALGCAIGRSKSKRTRRALMWLAVAADLGTLCCFKYLGMILGAFTAVTGISTSAVPVPPLPIGISFYTFQAMSYVIDVYRGTCGVQQNPLYLGLYISFFPQLIAGPIVKYKDIEAQLLRRQKSLEKTAEGIRRFLYGLGKKVLIANVLAGAVDSLYALEITQITGAMAWIMSVLYTLQIYYDFSGYSDMAIGLGKMFGFDFHENFQYPYTSLSIREFWNRWHVSLGSWFKEYVYIPLGGNRRGTLCTYRNLLIVFFLTGLWHGAGGSFILWGLFHGFLVIFERFWLGSRLKKSRVLAWSYTFLTVNFGWVLFRAERINDAFNIMKRMILPWRYTLSDFILAEAINPHVILIAALALLGMGFLQRKYAGTIAEKMWKDSIAEYIFLIAVLFLCFSSLAADSYNPFIYFRF